MTITESLFHEKSDEFFERLIDILGPLEDIDNLEDLNYSVCKIFMPFRQLISICIA